MASKKTVILTGASHGIRVAIVQAFLGRGYRHATGEVLHVDGGARMEPW